MRRVTLAAISVLLALALVPALVLAKPGSGARPGSGVRGTVLDTTCETGCVPECPPPPSCRRVEVACPQQAGASIVCPLHPRPLVCTQAGCPPPPVETPDFPPYEGTAATVLIRRTGSAKVLGRVPVSGGRFTAHLGPGRYVLRAHVAEPCWTGNREVVEVEAGRWIPLVLRVGDSCVAHPGARPALAG
ncbi:MAG TPA: hypothetical protein VGG40_07880 [Solirubrobacterales bacterium]